MQTNIRLFCSPLKRQSLAYGVEKATELGVHDIHFVRCAFTDAPSPPLDKLEARAIEAAEQCGRLQLPRLHALVGLADSLAQLDQTYQLLFCDESSDSDTGFAPKADFTKTNWIVLIGPEAGFRDDERAMLAADPRAYRVNLGPQTLRAETAIVSALAILQFQLKAHGAFAQ